MWSGGDVGSGPGTALNDNVTTPKLDTQKRQIPIVEVRGDKGYVTTQEQLRQQSYKEAIEKAFAALTQRVADNETLLRQIQAAQASADAAQSTASDTRDKQDLADSYTNPTAVASYANTGTITISTHSRVYPVSGTTVSVNGGSVSGFAEGDYVTVYYVDAGRNGGAVTYIGTTNAVAQTDGKHIVAQGRIPEAGNPPASGGGPTGPGYTPINPEGGGTGGTEYQ